MSARVGVQLVVQGGRQGALAETPVDLFEQPQPMGEYLLGGTAFAARSRAKWIPTSKIVQLGVVGSSHRRRTDR